LVTFAAMYPDMVLYEMSTWDHVLAGIICILAPVLAFTSRKMTTEDIQLDSDNKIRLYHSNALLLIVFGLVVTTTWRIPGRPLMGLGLDWPLWHPYVPLLLLAVFLFYSIDIFLQYGNRKRRERTYERRHKSFVFVPTDGKELLHFIFLALAAGIGEEIIFRGYLINYLITWTGNDMAGIIVACIASSALFAFLHGYQGVSSMIKILFLTLLFCAIFILTKSLLIVILVHAIIDTLSGIAGVYLIKDVSRESDQ